MSFPSKDDRQKCWGAKDRYWECLDKHENKPEVCAKLRETYVTSCSSQWIKHFDRKRQYLQFKDKLENEGYDPVNSSGGK